MLIDLHPEPFTPTMCAGFEGAESFNNGDDPYTASTFLDDTEVMLVVGAGRAELLDCGRVLAHCEIAKTSALQATVDVVAALQFAFKDGSVRSSLLATAGWHVEVETEPR